MVRFKVLMLLLSIFSCSSASEIDDTNNGYIREICSVTHYPDLCIHSLSSFSRTAGQSPSRWARASVSVTIGEAKKVALYLSTLNRSNRTMRGRNKVALSDCIECFGDALDNLHKSLYVLRKLSAREFSSQVDDVATWVSAALTDEDTCMDGFSEGGKGKRVRSIVNRVSNVTYMTSNALALIDKLATAGPRCLIND
ncbi:plant invertase/pectin methylesterase inhibitor [Striga asiatica]|uniref:Plant invertase/pectin methylesterase inhibitor n=1 Tax=Striga asiatica TaxID=4170 RepID=A0A5A7PQQ6_STRAF|nr:plant invertase/pectin methylesterase inhibitor [Striga asiatica]